MKRPERPETLFAVLVAVAALLFPSGIANATPTANGDAVSATADSAKSDSAAEKKDEDDEPAKDPDKIRDQLSDLSDDYKKAADRLGTLDKQRAKLTHRIRATKKQAAESRERVVQTAQAAYTSGNVDSSVVALTSEDDPDEIVDQMTTLSILAEQDNAAIADAERDRKRLQKQQRSLAETIKSAKKEKAGLAAKKKKLNAALLEAARAAAKRANGRASRSAKITNGGACPIGSPYTVMDTFGAPRGGGSRSHEGVDIPAPRGTPIYAVEDGVIGRAYSNTLGGIALILEGESGDSYYYAHQQENLVSAGEKVVAGQKIATVGMTGGAQGTIYHLHFERWPGGGNAVDPYPFVYALCGKKG